MFCLGFLIWQTHTVCVTKLAGPVSRAGNKLDPSGLYQKSYPGSNGVTVGNLILGQKAGVSGNGKAKERRPL